MTQPASHRSDSWPAAESLTGPIDVLVVTADPGTGTAPVDGLASRDRFSVEAVATPPTPARLDATDCVVADDLGPDALRDLLDGVRSRDPALPLVHVSTDPSRAAVEALSATSWTDRVQVGADAAPTEALARRVRTLVERRRATSLARRALAALAQGSDPVAIVDPAGVVEYATPLFARRFGTTPEDLAGRSWRSLYPDDEARRLESDAFPSLADGWRWIGDCELRRVDGATLTAQTRIDALDDGGMVFTLSDRG